MIARLTPRVRVLLLLMLGVHGIALGCGLLASYDTSAQHRDLPLAPPSRVRLKDAAGRWHVWPFVYRVTPRTNGEPGYEEDVSRRYPLRLLASHLATPERAGSVRRLMTVDPPAHLFLLGTDQYGRDQFSRLLHGARISLVAGLAATALTLFIGLVLGTLAGYFSGLDAALMRAADLATAVPWIYLLLAARSMFPLDIAPSQTLVMVVSIIALLGWARPARLVRSIVLSVRSREFVLAARSCGASNWYLLRRHVVPHTTSVMLTQAALLVPQFILAETTLSFLGLGVGEPTPSWGAMLSAAQQYHVLVSCWWMLAPGAALIVICYLYQALADAIQEHAGRVA
jgi:peptide/nickel transport system permease protein